MPVTTDTGLETREFKLRGLKVDSEGIFEGYASTFGNVDSYGDVIAAGAFRKTLSDQPDRPLLWCHDPREPIGKVTLSEDARGLRVSGALLLSLAKAREVYDMMRAGIARGLSVGFFVRRTRAGADGGRIIEEAELVEVSATPFPANPLARIETVRSKPAFAEKREELSEMELKAIETKFDEFGAKLAELGAKFDETRRQVDAIDGRLQSAALSPRGGGADFAAELVRKFREAKDGFDRFGKVRFEVRTVTSAGITTPQPSAEIGLAGAPSYGAVRRLFRVVAADAASVFAIRETSAAGWVASPAAETTAKSQATVSLTAETLPIRTIAVWIPASKQALDDVPGLENFIRSRLLWALEAEIEEQLLLGDGTGENLSGLMLSAASFDSSILGSYWNRADVIGGAAVQVRLAGFEPNFVIMHPRDVFRLRHTKDTLGQYVALPPLPRIVESAALSEGEFIVGDASQAAIRARESAAIEISTEHSDYFTRNMVAIRAEERLALQVISPSAFVKGALTTSPA